MHGFSVYHGVSNPCNSYDNQAIDNIIHEHYTAIIVYVPKFA